MNLEPHTQALMLSALYGELSEVERAEWEATCARNPALIQEFERLKATIAIVNDAETEEEEDVFFAEQWKGLQSVMNAGLTPIQIELPAKEKRRKKAAIFRLENTQKHRKYWAVAATAILMAGAGASIYRWQFGDIPNTEIQKSESQEASNPKKSDTREFSQSNQTSQSFGSQNNTNFLASPSLPKQPLELPNFDPSSEGDNSKGKTIPRQVDDVIQIHGKSKLLKEKEFENSFDSNGFDGNGFDKNSFDKNGFDRNGKDKFKPELQKETPQSVQSNEQKKNGVQQQNTSPMNINTSEVEEFAPKAKSSNDFHDTNYQQIAPPKSTSPQELSPTNLKPSSILPSPQQKAYSTNATIKVDSTLKRDSTFPRK
ncbi:MAG: hypothetical protein ACOVSW_09350 [Candidatus Kapaibacteriota bacterium]